MTPISAIEKKLSKKQIINKYFQKQIIKKLFKKNEIKYYFDYNTYYYPQANEGKKEIANEYRIIYDVEYDFLYLTRADFGSSDRSSNSWIYEKEMTWKELNEILKNKNKEKKKLKYENNINNFDWNF